MSKQKQQSVELPPGMNENAVLRRYGHFLAAYDVDQNMGGIYSMNDRMWQVLWPIDAMAFSDYTGKFIGQLLKEKASPGFGGGPLGIVEGEQSNQ